MGFDERTRPSSESLVSFSNIVGASPPVDPLPRAMQVERLPDAALLIAGKKYVREGE